MFWFWDPTIILLIPALIFALWAQNKVKGEYMRWSQVLVRRGLTGAEVAKMILSANRLDVKIETTPVELGDHYDPRRKVLRLSPGVYGESTIAAVGIAAHECGHAIQHAKSYAPLVIRSAIVPVVSLGTNLAFPLFIFGIFFAIPSLVKLGIILFSGAVAFHLVTLPVEFDASKRALNTLSLLQILSPEELEGARRVLNAAALTYVAAAAMAILNLLRMILIARRR